MDLEKCRSFLVVAEELSFSSAAKRLFLTQQAVSKHISSLERTYGVRLINREPTLSLTEAGECLYRYVAHVLEIEKHMLEDLDAIKGKNEKMLTIGVSHYRSSIMIPDIVNEFTQNNPHVRIKILEANLATLMDSIKRRKLDCAFGYDTVDTSIFTYKTLFLEHCVLLISKKMLHTKFSVEEQQDILGRKENKLVTFARCPMIRMSNNSWGRKQLDACCQSENITPNIVFESNNIMTIIEVCANGLGVTVCPEAYLKKINPDIKAKLYSFRWDYPSSEANVSLIYLKNSFLSATTIKFVTFCQGYFNN